MPPSRLPVLVVDATDHLELFIPDLLDFEESIIAAFKLVRHSGSTMLQKDSTRKRVSTVISRARECAFAAGAQPLRNVQDASGSGLLLH